MDGCGCSFKYAQSLKFHIKDMHKGELEKLEEMIRDGDVKAKEIVERMVREGKRKMHKTEEKESVLGKREREPEISNVLEPPAQALKIDSSFSGPVIES